MKILVTGATGFIGTHVVRELLAGKHSIIATGRSGEFHIDGVPRGKLSYIPCDLNEAKNDYCSFFGFPDSVIHLSWQGLPHYKERYHFERNLPANYNFLKSLVEGGVSNVTCVGTCLEYGMRNGPLSEEMQPRPSTAYSLAKDCLRRFLDQLREQTSFSFKWVRLFYTYGEGQNKSSLLEQLKTAIENRDTKFDMSKGDQLRDYLPVEKVAENIVKIALQSRVEGAINCCCGAPISIRQLAEDYLAARGVPMQLNLGVYPYPDYEPMAFWGDTRKLALAISSAAEKL